MSSSTTSIGGALAAARAIADRLRAEVPECPAGLGVSVGDPPTKPIVMSDFRQ